MLVVWPAGAPARFNNVDRWLWIPAQGRDDTGDFRDFIMTHPSIHARTKPEKIAYQMAGTGKAITYRELDELSNQGAHLFRALGLKAGDHVAFLIENRLAFIEICWAGSRSWDPGLAKQPTTPIPDEGAGTDMLYSSGTTGRPKGIKRKDEKNSIDL